GGVGVDLELGADGSSRGVEAAGEQLTRGAGVRPDHGERAARVHAHRGRLLGAGGVGRHVELAAHRVAGGVVALPADAVAGAVHGGPGDDEAAVVLHAQGGPELVAGDV